MTSAPGAELTWTLPLGLLIMVAVANRFNPAYEEAARDLGPTPSIDALGTVTTIVSFAVMRRMHTHLMRLESQLQFALPADAAPDLAQLSS